MQGIAYLIGKILLNNVNILVGLFCIGKTREHYVEQIQITCNSVFDSDIYKSFVENNLDNLFEKKQLVNRYYPVFDDSNVVNILLLL